MTTTPWAYLTERQKSSLFPPERERAEWLARKRYMEPQRFTRAEERELRALIAKARFLGRSK